MKLKYVFFLKRTVLKCFSLYMMFFVLALFTFSSCSVDDKPSNDQSDFEVEFLELVYEKYPDAVEANQLSTRMEFDCSGGDNTGSCLEIGTQTDTVFVESLNCTVVVEYDLEVCFSENISSLHFNNFTAGHTIGCDSLDQAWADLVLEGDFITLDQEIENMINEASQAAEEAYWEDFFAKQFFACDGPEVFLTSEWIASNCYATCYKWNPSGSPFVFFETAKCGQGCCRRTTSICFNPDGSVEIVGVSNQVMAECKPSEFGPECSKGFFPIVASCGTERACE